jgi:hypothetical protein
MDPLLFKEAMAIRIFSRTGIAPGHGLYINVLVLGYMFYNSIFRVFELVPHSNKLLAFEGTPLEEMAQGLTRRPNPNLGKKRSTDQLLLNI